MAAAPHRSGLPSLGRQQTWLAMRRRTAMEPAQAEPATAIDTVAVWGAVLTQVDSGKGAMHHADEGEFGRRGCNVTKCYTTPEWLKNLMMRSGRSGNIQMGWVHEVEPAHARSNAKEDP
jgi:hypothetical protein